METKNVDKFFEEKITTGQTVKEALMEILTLGDKYEHVAFTAIVHEPLDQNHADFRITSHMDLMQLPQFFSALAKISAAKPDFLEDYGRGGKFDA